MKYGLPISCNWVILPWYTAATFSPNRLTESQHNSFILLRCEKLPQHNNCCVVENFLQHNNLESYCVVTRFGERWPLCTTVYDLFSFDTHHVLSAKNHFLRRRIVGCIVESRVSKTVDHHQLNTHIVRGLKCDEIDVWRNNAFEAYLCLYNRRPDHSCWIGLLLKLLARIHTAIYATLCPVLSHLLVHTGNRQITKEQQVITCVYDCIADSDRYFFVC